MYPRPPASRQCGSSPASNVYKRRGLASYEGGDIEIGFNPGFINEALKVIDDPQVIIELKATNKPGLLRSGPDFVYVVMPVNLQ